ncbi:uncharacterized protein LOC121736383 [Aricia agestis]|uniref:uncharacterized protein LOC121736383 n=1 Tax=Aricia agestis TaxID=91739 RepID=UPI001C201B2F|nr:uncharacterized protein LOC121736383 [Aricia agestis]
MEFIPETPYLKVPPDTLQVVRDDIGMGKPGEMKEAVRILDEWVHQQPHFIMKDIPPHYLEMTIVMSKGSLEKAKRVLENMYAARTDRPDYFEAADPYTYYETFKDEVCATALPKLTSEYYRMQVTKHKGRLTRKGLEALIKFSFSCLDYIKSRDYVCGIVVVFDIRALDLNAMLRDISMLLDIKNALLTFLNAYGMRLKRIHMISSSKLVHGIMSFFKSHFSKKIFDRIMVHEQPQELLQFYPRAVLPQDFGGDEKNLDDLELIGHKAISGESHLAHMRLMSACRLDPALDPSKQLNEVDGVSGTFRTLNID